jgi:hypothetical protein
MRESTRSVQTALEPLVACSPVSGSPRGRNGNCQRYAVRDSCGYQGAMRIRRLNRRLMRGALPDYMDAHTATFKGPQLRPRGGPALRAGMTRTLVRLKRFAIC